MNYYKSIALKLLFLLIILVLTYLIFYNFFYSVEIYFSLFLNKLLNNKINQYLFSILSHKNESWINVIIMLSINGLSIFLVKDNNDSNNTKFFSNKIFLILYCWLSFQIVLLINNILFQKFLQINRVSPSLLIPGFIRLSKILNNLNIKDYSYNSFPAGHALILIYWILFINLYANKLIKFISWLLGALLIFPRIVTGAHWLSDTLFSILLGWMYFYLSIWILMYYEQIKKRIY